MRNSSTRAGRRSAEFTVLILLVWCFSSPGHLEDCFPPWQGGWAVHVDTDFTDNGDGDGFGDTNETLQIGLTVAVAGADWDAAHCYARISTDSPAIDCIPHAEIFVGTIPVPGPPVTPSGKFEVKIGDVDRETLGLGPDDPLDARLDLELGCRNSGFWAPAHITLPLDLNLDDSGQVPSPWFEGFEEGVNSTPIPLEGTKFEGLNIDAGIPGNNNSEGLYNADGWRCQYTDPDWINSTIYNQDTAEDCYPGMNLGQANAVFWQIDGQGALGTPDGGRAFSGTRSMYYGVFLGEPQATFTTPLSVVEAAGTTIPINLGANGPRLSFWQQISLADHRFINMPYPFASDRGVAQIQLEGAAGDPIAPWMNLQPVQNSYHAVDGAEGFFNCNFDPVDDGNDEDDFYDPTDPDRDWGPSSTCIPTPVWTWLGATTGDFDVGNVGQATTPPTADDEPSLGAGTWVQSEFDLTEFRGRRARIRFLVASIKASAETYYDQFGPEGENDDGWWVDDVLIDETLPEPAEFSNDNFVLGTCSATGGPCIGQCRSSLAPCSATMPCGAEEGDCVTPCPAGEVCSGPPPECPVCTEVAANIFVEPAGLLNPDSVSTLEPLGEVCMNAAGVDEPAGAEPSWADACPDGYLEYRLCASGDPDGDGPDLPDDDCDDPQDYSISPYVNSWPWSLKYFKTVHPEVVTTYAFEVRCATAPDCRDGQVIEVVVNCPGGEPNTLGLRAMRALNRDMLSWSGVLDVDWLRGSFVSGSEIGNYDEDFTDLAQSATSIPMAGEPPAGAGYYYLVKAEGPVNPFVSTYDCDTATWRSGGEAERNEPARNFSFGDPN